MKLTCIVEIDLNQPLFDAYARQDDRPVNRIVAEAVVACEERITRALRCDAVSHVAVKTYYESERARKAVDPHVEPTMVNGGVKVNA